MGLSRGRKRRLPAMWGALDGPRLTWPPGPGSSAHWVCFLLPRLLGSEHHYPPHPPFLKGEKGRIRSWRGEAGSQTQPGAEQPGSPPSVAALERGGRASVSRGPARTRDAGPTGVGDVCGSRGAELEPGPGSHRTADSAPRRSELPIRGGIQAGLAVGRFPRHTVMGPGLPLGRTGSSDYTSGIDP